MEKTLYIDNIKFAVEVSNYDWHQNQNEIQCILIFLSVADKNRFLKELEDFCMLQLDDMYLSQHWYNDINDTQAITFGAYYSIPHTDSDSSCEPSASVYDGFGLGSEEIIF